MIDNAKIAKIEEDIKATNAKVKDTDAKIKATDAKVDATNAKVDATDAKVNSINQVPASTAADAGKVLTVGDDGTVSWQTKGAGGGMKAFFDAGGKCGNSTATSFDGIINFGDTADLTTMIATFSSCQSITSMPLLDTSKVIQMSQTFGDCNALVSVPLFDTSNVEQMRSLFENCTSLTDVPEFNTSNVTDMYAMFYGCYNLAIIPAFDVSNVTDMGFMFDSCTSLAEIHMQNIGADLDIRSSEAFTTEALNEIIGNLKTLNGETKTLTMGANNLDKLSEEDKAVATNKGWTLA